MASNKPFSIKQLGRSIRRYAAFFWLNSVHHRTTQIAITGSYGKTSTSYIIFRLLKAYFSTAVTDTNLDTLYNLPLTALKLRGEQYVVFETGIDHPGEMDFHLGLIDPDISVITGIAPVHADHEHLGSVDNIIQEKRRLIEVLKPDRLAVLHYDDPAVRDMAPYTQARVVFYGTMPGADFRAEEITVSPSSSRFRAVTPKGAFEVETPLLGRHNCSNAMAAVAIGIEAGLTFSQIQDNLASLQPLPGRMSVEPGPLGTTLINDALRANIASVKAGLQFLSDYSTQGKRVAILGEMGEIGTTEIEEHQSVGKFAANLGNIDRLVCIGNLTEHTAKEAINAGLPKEHVFVAFSVQDAAKAVRSMLVPGDVIYLKGSLLRHLERVKLLLNGIPVGCHVPSCPFYHQCDVCRYRIDGYKP